MLRASCVTIGLSVFAHRISAAPLTGAFSLWRAAHPRRRRAAIRVVGADTASHRGTRAR
jgi:hypothetical protein